MIPILYDKDEVAFTSNGLGRLRDCISCIVTEERNGIYECDFEYPVAGANYERIQVGRIIGVTHDDTGDVQPFDIVSYSKPIDGIVKFHCTHISYRLSYYTVRGTNINSLAAALTLLKNSAVPTIPFTFETDKTSTGYFAAADGTPRSVRQMLGGIEGSLLDSYGGEYKFDRWTVNLLSARGQRRNFAIRYGVNMLNYNEDYSTEGAFSSCIPFWTDGTETVVGSRVDATGSTITGRGECVPLDLSDKFEEKPSTTALRAEALSYMNGNNTTAPAQTIEVEFMRLQDSPEYQSVSRLLSCSLCDTIPVYFPDLNATGDFKIVKIEWNALSGRYEKMELGTLSTTLAEALGVSETLSRSNGSGGGSGGGDKTYVHTQSTASATWTIQHNLGKMPSVTIVDSAGSIVAGDCNYINANSVVVTFHGEFAGRAYLN